MIIRGARPGPAPLSSATHMAGPGRARSVGGRQQAGQTRGTVFSGEGKGGGAMPLIRNASLRRTRQDVICRGPPRPDDWTGMWPAEGSARSARRGACEWRDTGPPHSSGERVVYPPRRSAPLARGGGGRESRALGGESMCFNGTCLVT